MSKHSTQIKTTLLSAIDAMASHVEDFVRTPGKDFTRHRTLDFQTVIRFILSSGSNTLSEELFRFFSMENFPTASALVQQRDKILPEAFLYLLKTFNQTAQVKPVLFNGYRLLAMDGTGVSYPFNPNEPEYIFRDKHCNIMHVHTLYDVCTKSFLDAAITSGHVNRERDIAVTFIQNTSEQYPVIFLADRGYETYNLFAHIEQRLFDYVIRIKDIHSSGILSALDYPDSPEFDITQTLTITRHSTGPAAIHRKTYKYLSKGARFDFIPDLTAPDYLLTIRFVRFRLSDGSYAALATSLSEELFPVSKLKELYQMRWGIETAYRELKTVLGMGVVHSKKAANVMQEVYARLIMYNFSMFICSVLPLQPQNHKHPVQINFSQALKLCMHFFRFPNDSSPPDIEAMILRFILPVRSGRSFPRKAVSKTVSSFTYRLS